MVALRGTSFVSAAARIGTPSTLFSSCVKNPVFSRRRATILSGVRGQRSGAQAAVTKAKSQGFLALNVDGGLLETAAFWSLPISAAIAGGVYSAPDFNLSAIASDPGSLGSAGIFALLGLKLAAMVQSGIGTVRGVNGNQLIQVISGPRETLVLDIRKKAAVRKEGRPSWGRYGKISISLPYSQSGKSAYPDPCFAEKVGKLRGLKPGTVLILMDSNGQQAPAAARQIRRLIGGKRILYLKGGTAGWKAAGLPWKAPLAAPKLPEIKVPEIKVPEVRVTLPNPPSLGLDDLTESYRKRPGVYNAGLAFGAAVMSVAVVFSEVDLLLEVVGFAVATQLLGRKLFFAKDRKETLRQLRALRDEKIAVAEAGNDFKRLADTVLSFKKKQNTKPRSPAPGEIVTSGTPSPSL